MGNLLKKFLGDDTSLRPYSGRVEQAHLDEANHEALLVDSMRRRERVLTRHFDVACWEEAHASAVVESFLQDRISDRKNPPRGGSGGCGKGDGVWVHPPIEGNPRLIAAYMGGGSAPASPISGGNP